MIVKDDIGLYCAAGNFYIDPLKTCENALITHAHADHARPGMTNYICTHATKDIMKLRIGHELNISSVDYEQEITLGNATVSFHSAGHILGSAQIRIKVNDKTTVVTGDYKVHKDDTCDAFQYIECNTFISEATFANPKYVWTDFGIEIERIYNWYLGNKNNGVNSVLCAYSLGKSQRIINALNTKYKVDIYAHDNIRNINKIYQDYGISNLQTKRINENKDMTNGLIVIPPGARKANLLKNIGRYKTGFCSGWAINRLDEYDEGFKISDHADWNELISAITKSKAKEVILIHGTGNVLKKYLNTKGIQISDFTRSNIKESTMQLSMFNE